MISFVYFDIGGVSILDFSKTDKWEIMKRDLGVKKEFDKEFDKLFDEYESNGLNLNLDVDSLIPVFKEKFGIKVPNNYSWLTDFVNRFDKNPSLWPVMQEMKQTCGLGLITNMYPRMLNAIIAKGLMPPGIKWSVILDSSVEQLQKPDPKIYKMAQDHCLTKSSEILFVDNLTENLVYPKILGWQTFHYDSANPEKSSQELLAYFKTHSRI